uniref:Uncharacterized protein n=1 Tax=Spongospora subterranea TaxID=70186 RepID=A0A0H5RCG3_9EUKA|eukprot:CRZ11441.1 hypothetical protein [Spongospora subterranea]
MQNKMVKLKQESKQEILQLESQISSEESMRQRESGDLIDRIADQENQVMNLTLQLKKLQATNRQLKDDRNRREMKVRTAMSGLRQALESELQNWDDDDFEQPARIHRRSRACNRSRILGSTETKNAMKTKDDADLDNNKQCNSMLS